MKILMADGNPGGYALVADILTQRGCDPLEVTGCPEALAIAHQQKPRVAIVDCSP
ncbi:MAG TPA: hypothetical protein VLO30_00590 [Chthoniobacterales bacterium]|nr:hypothetical protein [Chthoniobacterales bacterium]